MTELSDAELAAAERRGKKLLETEPQAQAARYDRQTGRVTVELTNGCSYLFPARLVEDLSHAADDDLEELNVDGAGFNLHWPRLDADLYVPALIAGIFGTKKWTQSALARAAGSATSPAKAAAAWANGAKGGRPRKTA